MYTATSSLFQVPAKGHYAVTNPYLPHSAQSPLMCLPSLLY